MSWWRGFGGPRVPARVGPASNPFAPGGCRVPLSAASEAYEYLVIGLANPFALRWVPTNIAIDGLGPGGIGPGFPGQIFALGRTMPLPNSSGVIHPGDGGHKPAGDGMVWHHVSIGVDGEAIFPTDAIPANPERFANGGGNRSTMLKARVTLSMSNSRTRRFDIDVGAGVEFDVRCRAVVSIEALVPDPTSVPEAFPADLVGPFTFAVALVTTVTCGCCPQGYKMPLTYSQPFFLGPLGAFMPIMPDAREVEIFASDAGEAAAPAVIANFIYQPTSPLVPFLQVGALPPFAPMGGFNSPVGEQSTRRVIIPGNANAIFVVRGSVSDGTTINVVQILNV